MIRLWRDQDAKQISKVGIIIFTLLLFLVGIAVAERATFGPQQPPSINIDLKK